MPRSDQLAQLGFVAAVDCTKRTTHCRRSHPICSVQTPTTTKVLKAPWPSRVTVRVSGETHGLLHTMARAEGYKSAADLVRYYLARGMAADGIDPLEVGLLPTDHQPVSDDD